MESTQERHNGARPRPQRPPPPSTQSDTRPCVTTDTMRHIKERKEEALLYIQQGLSCDESHQSEQALTLYKRGLDAISRTKSCYDIALRTEDTSSPSWQGIHSMVTNMMKTQEKINTRVAELESTDASVARALHDPPPSYDQSINGDLDFDLIDGGEDDLQQNLRNASQIFKIPDGVQIFFITQEGMVSAPSYPTSLGIYKFTPSPEDRQTEAPAFLKVGQWTYPLLPGRSPVLHASYGAYMFPDVTSADPGASVGLLLPDTVPAAEKTRFENILNELTDFHEQTPQTRHIPPRPPPPLSSEQQPSGETTSDKISEGIVSAAGWLSSGLTQGAEKASEWLRRGSTSLKQRLTPEEQPSHIDPQLKKGMHYARKATGAAVKVTGFVVVKLAQGTAALAKELAPHIRAGSEKVLPDSFTKKGSDGQSKIDDIAKVAHGGLKGFGTLHLALEKAAITLGHALSEETKSVIGHKYGEEAGAFAGDAVGTGVNTVLTVGIASNIGPKLVAKTAVKQYARDLVVEDKEKSPEDTKTESKKLKAAPDEAEQVYLSKQSLPGYTPSVSYTARSDTGQNAASTQRDATGSNARPPVTPSAPDSSVMNGQHMGMSAPPRSTGASQPQRSRPPSTSLYPAGTAPPRLPDYAKPK